MDVISTRKVVLGLGNILFRDEGLGIHCLDALQGKIDPHDTIELVDGGTLGLNLLPLVETCSHLLVLDAVDGAEAPGTIIEIDNWQVSAINDINLSEHQMEFQNVVGIALFEGRLPAFLHVIGIQPADLNTGLGVSQEVQNAIPQVIARAQEVLKSWQD